jgi:UPF0716 protein FxsA
VLVGGVLLLTPGFLSDIVGVLCLLPPTRAVLRPRLTRLVASRLGLGAVAGGRRSETRRRPSYGDVIDGEVVDAPAQREGPPPGGDGPNDGTS